MLKKWVKQPIGGIRAMSSGFKTKLDRALRFAVRSLRKFAYASPLPPRYPRLTSTRPRIGLALSGGFARGLAHIGVLKALTENRIPIDALAGTSVGSVIAGAFASGRKVEEMEKEARKVRWGSFARWTVARLGVATNERMEGMLRRVLGCSKFEDLLIPLAVVAADLSTGKPVTFRSGDLIPPLRGSCSVPGLFTPVEYQGHLLVDGAICCSVPVAPLLEFGVDAIIAVNLRTDGLQHTPTNMFQVIDQAFRIAQKQNDTQWREQCDVIIEPEVGDIRWDDFTRAAELIQAGERAGLQALPAIRALFESRPVPQAPVELQRANNLP